MAFNTQSYLDNFKTEDESLQIVPPEISVLPGIERTNLHLLGDSQESPSAASVDSFAQLLNTASILSSLFAQSNVNKFLLELHYSYHELTRAFPLKFLLLTKLFDYCITWTYTYTHFKTRHLSL